MTYTSIFTFRCVSLSHLLTHKSKREIYGGEPPDERCYRGSIFLHEVNNKVKIRVCQSNTPQVAERTPVLVENHSLVLSSTLTRCCDRR